MLANKVRQVEHHKSMPVNPLRVGYHKFPPHISATAKTQHLLQSLVQQMAPRHTGLTRNRSEYL